MARKAKLLFYSQYAFYRPLYRVYELVCERHGLDGSVITHEAAEVPRVYAPAGFLSPQSAGLDAPAANVTVLPKSLRADAAARLLREKISALDPDFLWVHEEPNNFFLTRMLRWFYFRRRPRIVAAVVENRWPVSASLGGRYAVFKRSLLWRRLDGVLACASLSLEGVRRFGLPASVPSQVAWLPHLTPPSLNGRAPFLPVKEPGQIFVGFAGRITAAKGWRVLLEAMRRLPGEFQVLLAGGGEEEEDLRAACAAGDLRGRARVLGVLEKENLWAFYRSLDVLVLPSVSTPQWTEQFGSVMAEAMACGVPVIGSSSGAIPEVLGGCGVVVPENDAAALAQAIRELADDPQRCKALAEKGRQRFEEKFTIARYAERVAAALGLQP